MIHSRIKNKFVLKYIKLMNDLENKKYQKFWSRLCKVHDEFEMVKEAVEKLCKIEESKITDITILSRNETFYIVRINYLDKSYFNNSVVGKSITIEKPFVIQYIIDIKTIISNIDY
jgi:hypothetical protein